jgi:hypothetical protein
LTGIAARLAWVTDFVNHLARSDDAQRNPNAALRLHAEIVPGLTKGLISAGSTDQFDCNRSLRGRRAQ